MALLACISIKIYRLLSRKFGIHRLKAFQTGTGVEEVPGISLIFYKLLSILIFHFEAINFNLVSHGTLFNYFFPIYIQSNAAKRKQKNKVIALLRYQTKREYKN